MRTHSRGPDEEGTSCRPRPAPTGDTAADPVLDLQRLIGNAATSRFLTGAGDRAVPAGGALTVQRVLKVGGRDLTANQDLETALHGWVAPKPQRRREKQYAEAIRLELGEETTLGPRWGDYREVRRPRGWYQHYLTMRAVQAEEACGDGPVKREETGRVRQSRGTGDERARSTGFARGTTCRCGRAGRPPRSVLDLAGRVGASVGEMTALAHSAFAFWRVHHDPLDRYEGLAHEDAPAFRRFLDDCDDDLVAIRDLVDDFRAAADVDRCREALSRALARAGGRAGAARGGPDPAVDGQFTPTGARR